MRGIVAEMFDLYGGGRGLFSPGGAYSGRPPRSVLALAPGEIPTTSLYLKGRIEERFGVSVHYVDGLKTSPERVMVDDDAWIVIVRYAPPRWLRWLERQRQKLAGVVYLLDDDIPSAVGAMELPLMYALKTAWRYARTRRLLERLCSEVWVSTPELAGRYPSARPKLWEPHYLDSPFSAERPVVYFYHGTWAHRQEIEWLVSVVRRVQESVPHACFEIMGTAQVRRLYRGIPRVRIVHPMPWTDYLAYAGTIQYHVGLAPCFDTFFNRARSHNKIFDITRLGAAGIYSNSVPYADKIVHGQTGLLCENSEDSWVAAITSLLQDVETRAAMYQGAVQWCKNLPH
jgi:glycosyltransferase involved in cell wall biosynthesis